MLRVREARRKERPKMKHVGSDLCKDIKRSTNSCRNPSNGVGTRYLPPHLHNQAYLIVGRNVS